VASFLEAAISGTFSCVPAIKSASPLSAFAAASTYYKEGLGLETIEVFYNPQRSDTRGNFQSPLAFQWIHGVA
jgi:hypothetical protein